MEGGDGCGRWDGRREEGRGGEERKMYVGVGLAEVGRRFVVELGVGG